MTITNKTKIILFAGIIVAMILPFGGIQFADAIPAKKVDSLSIPNAERDTKLNAGFKLYAGGWVSPNRDKVNASFIENPNKPGEMILDLNAMEKKYNNQKKAKIMQTSGNLLQDIWSSIYQIAEAAQTSYHIAVKDSSSNDITSHRAYWTVPDSPGTYKGGTNYDFNAVQPNISSNVIMQPVLQHGYGSWCDAGDDWVTYPFIYAFGNAYGGSCIDANEGDKIRGTLKKGDNNVWTVTIKNYQNSAALDSYSVAYNGNMEMVFTSVETWNIPKDCSELQGNVTYSKQLDSGDVDSWSTLFSGSTFCGQTTKIVSDSKVEFTNNS